MTPGVCCINYGRMTPYLEPKWLLYFCLCGCELEMSKTNFKHFMPKMSDHMLVWFQVNNFRIRVGKKGLGHIMTHNDTVSF